MRARALVLVPLLGTLAGASAGSAQLQTWIVDDTPAPPPDFTDIQSAVDAAAEGDTILVEAGSYPTFQIDAKSVSILAVAARRSGPRPR